MTDANDRLPTPTAEHDAAAVRARVLGLMEAHGDELRRFVRGVVRDPEVTADVLQATVSRALELGHTARPETLKGWLFRVAYHEALALRRREQAGDQARRKMAALRLRRGAEPAPADAGLIRSETADAVRRALDGLPDEQRKVVLARVYDEKTFDQIARDAGLPLGTVLTRMRLALARLRQALLAAEGPPRTDREPPR